jgi:glyoxylase-like metal-dependent hydrolase (beta-lactamase superfamily II)
VNSHWHPDHAGGNDAITLDYPPIFRARGAMELLYRGVEVKLFFSELVGRVGIEPTTN